jgi:hypothetical protein
VIRRALLLVGLPVGLAALVAVPLGLERGSYQWLCAAVAVALTVLPGLITLVLAERLGRGTPAARVLAVFLGTAIRLAIGFGGGVVVFFASGPTFRADPISFWLWVLGLYLVTLVVETSLLGRERVAGESRV